MPRHAASSQDQRSRETLERYKTQLGEFVFGDIEAYYQTFCQAVPDGHADQFLTWLQEQGIVTWDHVRSLHRRQRVQIDATGELGTKDLSGRGASAENRFEFLGRIGEGAMGEVHLIRDPMLGRKLALKALRGDKEKRAKLVSRFLTEAQITAQLEHPNIVPVYGLEQTDDGAPAFAMKVIEGKTFEEFIEECRELCESRRPYGRTHSLETRLEHFTRVCEAMAYAHEYGVIHRDLKPANIMVGAFGEVYVMDWGIARVLGDPEQEELRQMVVDSGDGEGTRFGELVGTPSYMPPEQALGHTHELSPKSDQYALGLILFELVSLQRAIGGDNAMLRVARAQQGYKQPLVHFGGEHISRALKAIIHKSTAFKADDRYTTVADLADDVRRFLRREAVRAMPEHLPRRMWRRLASSPAITVSGLAALLLFTGTALLISMVGMVYIQVSSSARADSRAALLATVARHASFIEQSLPASPTDIGVELLDPDLDAQIRFAALVDDQGTVIAGWGPNRLTPGDRVASLVQTSLDGPADGGVLKVNGDLVVFARLAQRDWSYVVSMDD